jgi:hypothetical protein
MLGTARLTKPAARAGLVAAACRRTPHISSVAMVFAEGLKPRPTIMYPKHEWQAAELGAVQECRYTLMPRRT